MAVTDAAGHGWLRAAHSIFGGASPDGELLLSCTGIQAQYLSQHALHCIASYCIAFKSVAGWEQIPGTAQVVLERGSACQELHVHGLAQIQSYS